MERAIHEKKIRSETKVFLIFLPTGGMAICSSADDNWWFVDNCIMSLSLHMLKHDLHASHIAFRLMN